MNHIMIDCETFGLAPNSVICTIGAVRFDPYTVGALGEQFHEAIDLKSSLAHGLTMDDAVLWWMEQPLAARLALVAKLKAGSSLSTVLGALTKFIQQQGHTAVCWSCGSRDFEWLEASYKAVKTPVPWHYRTRDYRTIRDEFGTKADEPPAGVSHDALSDALWQAQYLQNVFARLKQQKIDAELYAADHDYPTPAQAAPYGAGKLDG